MTVLSRATERSKFSRYRASLMFSNHLVEQPRSRTAWQAMIDEGSEPLLIDQMEARRMHIRNALIHVKAADGPSL